MISVIIPSYNRHRELLRAVESVKAQTTKTPVEIVVVNDGSTQPEYYKKWDGVKMIHLPKNTRDELGYPCAGFVRNVGIRASAGHWLAFLDDDDYWEPEKLQKQLDVGKPVVCCEGYLLGIENKTPFHSGVHNNYGLASMPAMVTSEVLESRNIILTSSVFVKREYGIYLTNGFKTDRPMGAKDGSGIFLDWEFWKEIAKITPFHFIPEPLVGYCSLDNQQY